MSPETPRPQPIPEEQLQPEPAGGVEGEGEAKSIEEIKQAEELPPELVSLVADLKTVFYSSSEQIKLSLSALNLKLTKKLDSIPDLEIKPSALEAITHELEIIYSQSRSTGQLTEEQYLAVKAMNYQLERAVDKLNSEKDALFERLNQLERDLDDEKAKESKLKYPSNFEVSRTRAQNYRTKSKLGQLVYRSFASRQHAKDLALEKETLQIETRLTELSEELVKVQKKIADLDDDIRQINSFRSDHRSLINISEKYINKRILRPATDQIESSIEEAAEKIKPYLVEEYLTKAVIPRLEQYQIRQVDQLLAEGDWLALKQEQRSKNNLAKLLSFQENENGNSNSQIFLSEQGRELFGLTEQDNRLTVVDLDRAAGTFKLKSTSSDKVSDPFSFEQIDELMLTRYNFEPGNKINQYKVVEWNLADRRLAVRKNQQEEVYCLTN